MGARERIGRTPVAVMVMAALTCLIVALGVARAAVAPDPPKITTYTTGISPSPGNGGIDAVTLGPDQNVWFTHTDQNKVGRITSDGTVTEFTPSVGATPAGLLTPANPGTPVPVRGEIASAAGSIYVTATSTVGGQPVLDRIARVNPSTGDVTALFTLPAGESATGSPASITSLAAGADGRLWMGVNSTGAAKTSLAAVNPDLSGYTSYRTYDAGAAYESVRRLTRDGSSLAFVTSAERVGSIAPTGLVSIPVVKFPGTQPLLATGQNLTSVAIGADNAYWLLARGAGTVAGAVIRIDRAGNATKYPLANVTLAGATSDADIVSAPDGNLWFTEPDGDAYARITPAGVLTQFTIGISGGTQPAGLTVGNDGNLWFGTSTGGGTIKRAAILGPDTVQPGISILTPSANQHLVQNAQVFANYSCADETGGSGVATCTGTVPNGAAIDTSKTGTFTFTVNATDRAGNAKSASTTYFVDAKDTVAPTATITTPANGARYAQGASVVASYACQDNTGGSGIASCTGTVPNGSALDTSKPGTYALSVTAADNQGNQTTQTNQYTVDGSGASTGGSASTTTTSASTVTTTPAKPATTTTTSTPATTTTTTASSGPVRLGSAASTQARRLDGRRLASVLSAGSLSTRFRAPASGTLTTTFKAAGKTIASATTAVDAGTKATVAARLSSAGRSLLKKARTAKKSVRVTLTYAFTAADGRKASPVSASATLKP